MYFYLLKLIFKVYSFSKKMTKRTKKNDKNGNLKNYQIGLEK